MRIATRRVHRDGTASQRPVGVGGFLLPFAFGSLASATGTFAAGFAAFAAVANLAALAVVGRERAWSSPALELAR